MGAGSVNSPMDLKTAPRGELIKIIYDQKDKIETLEIQLAEIRSRLNNQGPKPQDVPPAFIKANVKHKKKLEARRKRAENFSRHRSIPTKEAFHTYETCPDCHGRLGKPTVSYRRQIIDIPVSPVEITEHVVFKRWCFSCKKRVQPEVNLKEAAVGKQRIGLKLMSIINLLKEEARLPLETIQSYLEIVHNLHLAKGSLVNMLHKTAHIGKPIYDTLGKRIREADLVFADETGGRQNGRNGYYWNFNTRDIQFLVYDKSRSNEMVTRVLGKEDEKDCFRGVLSTDFYTGYNIYHGFHQRCWVHLLRDIKELKEKYTKHPPLNKWAKRVKQIYHEAKEYQGPNSTLSVRAKEQERTAKQQYFEEELRSVVKPWIQKESPMSTLCGRITKHLQELFVFVRFEGVPSDNNTAERVLRHTVVSRKISGGTRSEKGSETKSILASLFGTWRLQNRNPLIECQLLLATC